MNSLLSRLWHKLFYIEKWEVGYAEGSAANLLQQRALPPVKWWSTGNTLDFRADPFFLGDKVIYEHMSRWRGRADLRLATIDGRLLKTVLKTPGHLSYPCVFEHDDKVYLIPESAESGVLQILLLDDNEQLTEVSRIAQQIMDPTLLYKDGRFWLAGTDKELGAAKALCLWHAQSMEGPWIPHMHNPVKMDKQSSRPAGGFFSVDGELYRPAQDCSHGYGQAIQINKVLRMDTEEFEEVPLFRLEADSKYYPDGLHTLNMRNDLILVDGKRFLFTPLAMVLKLRNIVFRVSGS